MPLLDLLDAVGELVLPHACAGCRRPGAVLCAACRPGGPPRPSLVGGLTVVAAGDYQSGLRAALIAYKERGRTELARPLGTLLAAAVVGVWEGAAPACLVPVPSAARARRERGGDHVLRLARVASRATGLPVSRALRLDHEVLDSAGLGRGERAANLAGAFAATRGPGGRRPVVVDDIVTTGATLREAVRALESAGWAEPVAAVVAATPRRF
ncbi:MAG TPA: phosphoribosyltransferase family protein [Jatrophihabitantaceae bacterium]|nr:phosphoribosyltransferase family protein [Jatrophihabitantaceae bacterium]